MLRQSAVVKSGDDAQAGPLRGLGIDHFLSVIEAAAALRFTAERRIGGLRSPGAAARSLAHFLFRDPIAQADDHARYLALMRNIRK